MTRSPPQVQGNPERVIETSVQFGGKVCHYRLGVKDCNVLPHEKQMPLQGRAGAWRLRSPVSERGHRFQSQLCRELQGLASGAEPLQPSVSATPRSKCWTARQLRSIPRLTSGLLLMASKVNTDQRLEAYKSPGRANVICFHNKTL